MCGFVGSVVVAFYDDSVAARCVFSSAVSGYPDTVYAVSHCVAGARRCGGLAGDPEVPGLTGHGRGEGISVWLPAVDFGPVRLKLDMRLCGFS
jgi:hypothetical protein